MLCAITLKRRMPISTAHLYSLQFRVIWLFDSNVSCDLLYLVKMTDYTSNYATSPTIYSSPTAIRESQLKCPACQQFFVKVGGYFLKIARKTHKHREYQTYRKYLILHPFSQFDFLAIIVSV